VRPDDAHHRSERDFNPWTMVAGKRALYVSAGLVGLAMLGNIVLSELGP